jgi:Fe-S cluster biogenesis protein NfuA
MTVPEPALPSESRAKLRSRIEEVLDQSVRPELREDGSDVELVGIDDDCIVQIRLSGTCQGCSSAAISLALQIEATVKAQVPEIRFLEPVP